MLTLVQRAKIRLVLGYPSIYRFKHVRLESVFDSIDEESEALVLNALSSFETVEAQILEFLPTIGIKRVDDITFQDGPMVTINGLRRQGRMFVARVSILLGVPIASDVFGGSGYLGDAFLSPSSGTRNGGFFNLG